MKRFMLALAIGLLINMPALGELKDCPHQQVTSPKVLLDGVHILTDSAGPRTRAFQDRVRRRLWMRLNGLPELLANEGGVNLVECRERVPNSPGDFSDEIQRKMLDKGVLVEFWATVDSTSTDDDQPAFEAKVQWVSFPLGRSSDLSLGNEGIFSAPSKLALSDSARAVDSLLVPQRLLAAHVLLSMAIRDLSFKRYPEAYRRMCEAHGRLCADDSTFARTVETWIRRTADQAKAAGMPLLGVDVIDGREGGSQ